MFRHSASRGLTTLLFTDIVSSSEVAVELGDRRWRALQARHHHEVRRQLKRFHGHEVDTAGDGFFATFDTPAEGVRCAEAIIEGVRELGLEVRAGLHFGEAELTGEKVGGIAVTTAARVSASAGPGQVLVTSTVADLVAGSGLEFSDLGDRELKGVPGRWRVFELSRVDGAELPPRLGDTEAVERRDRAAPVGAGGVQRVRRGRRRPVLIAGVAVIALVAAALPFALHHRDAPPLAANGIQLLDATSGRRTGSVPLPGAPTALASGAGYVWVSDPQDGAVLKVDPKTRAVVDTIQAGDGPAGIAFGDGAVWVALSGAGQLARIDPSTGDVVTTDVGNGPTGVAASPGTVWVTNYIDDTVVRVDTTTNQVVSDSRIDVGSGPVSAAANAAGAWVANSRDGTVTRIPLGGQGTTTIRVGNGPAGIAIGSTGVWVTNNLDGTLSRIDTDNGVVTTNPVGDGPTGVTVDGATVWVADQFGGSIARVDAATGAVIDRIELDAAPVALTLVQGALWVAAAASPSVHRGGTLTFASERALDSIDPATAFTLQASQILSITNDGLLGFERVGGPQGSAVVADLATSVPVASDDGKVYTFQLRPGIQYSNGATVEPEDFRRGIERVLTIGPNGPRQYYSGIIGAATCATSSACDLTKGIVTNDAARTVTFHLAVPDPDFLYKLALTFADAVPSDTPLEAVGASPLPATGPYMIASYTPGAKGAIELVRNPRFTEWSQAAQPDGYPDRLEGSFGISAQQQVSNVEQGRLDVMGDTPPGNLLSVLNTRYPSQLHDAVSFWTYGFVMNTHAPPFDNVGVRQALNYAVDREELVRLSGGPQLNQVSCQILPPNFAGYSPYCPYTQHPDASGIWSAPDPGKAADLVTASGTRGTRITIWVAHDVLSFERVGRYLRTVLRGLGYDARLHVVPTVNAYFHAVQTPRISAKLQISSYGWLPDYPTPSQYMVPLFGCRSISSGSNTGHFCQGSIQGQINDALAAQASQPAAAGEMWAGVDRSIVDQAAWLILPKPLDVSFVSTRTHNVQLNPQLGMLLGQLWIQ